MKTVIITGGNGNLGSAVTQLFLERGYRVVVTVSSEKGKSGFAPHPNLYIYQVDLSQEKETAAFVDKVIEQYQVIDAALLLVGGFLMGNLDATSIRKICKSRSV